MSSARKYARSSTEALCEDQSPNAILNAELESRADDIDYGSNFTMQARLGPTRKEHLALLGFNSRRTLGESFDELCGLAFLADESYLIRRHDLGDWANPHEAAYDQQLDNLQTMTEQYLFTGDCLGGVDEFDLQVLEGNHEAVHDIGMHGYLAADTELGRLKGAAAQLAVDAQAAAGQARVALRGQFLGGGSGDMTSFMLWTFADHLTALSAELLSMVSSNNVVNIGTTVGPPVVTLLNTYANWCTTTAATQGTPMQGMNQLTNLVSTVGVINSFSGHPMHLMTSYLGPMVTAINTMMGDLQSKYIAQNDTQFALDGTVGRPQLEPGGQPVFDYMVQVMAARSARGLAEPDAAVLSYFNDRGPEMVSFMNAEPRRLREAGLEPSEVYPGNPELVKAWIFSERTRVWTLLYGNRDPSKATEGNTP